VRGPKVSTMGLRNSECSSRTEPRMAVPNTSGGTPRLVGAVVVVAVAIALAGCGTTRRTLGISRPVKFAPHGVRTLARRRLPEGTYFAIAALRYEFMGRSYAELGLRFESPSSKGLAASRYGGGTLLEPGGRGVLEMGVRRSCNEGDETALAWGLLRSPEDTVTAKSKASTTRFAKVMIPRSFYPHGALVYALLGPGPTAVVVRTPRGQIVSDMSWAAAPGGMCRGQ
jgi:hypothetical protein